MRGDKGWDEAEDEGMKDGMSLRVREWGWDESDAGAAFQLLMDNTEPLHGKFRDAPNPGVPLEGLRSPFPRNSASFSLCSPGIFSGAGSEQFRE